MSGHQQQEQSPWTRDLNALPEPPPSGRDARHELEQRATAPPDRAETRTARAPAGVATIVTLCLFCLIGMGGVVVGRQLAPDTSRGTITELRTEIKTARHDTAVERHDAGVERHAASRQARAARRAGEAAAALRVRLHTAQGDASRAANAANAWRARALNLQQTLAKTPPTPTRTPHRRVDKHAGTARHSHRRPAK